MSTIRRILDRAQPGPRRSVADHVRRGELIQGAIAEHWGITSPRQWRVKHLRWYLETLDRSPVTRYHHYRSIRAIMSAMGRWQNVEPFLRGPWMRPDGRTGAHGTGRPAHLAHRGRKIPSR